MTVANTPQQTAADFYNELLARTDGLSPRTTITQFITTVKDQVVAEATGAKPAAKRTRKPAKPKPEPKPEPVVEPDPVAVEAEPVDPYSDNEPLPEPVAG